MNGSRTLAPGGSCGCILRGSEALRVPTSTKLRKGVGPQKKDPTCLGASELGSYDDFMSASRTVVP